MQALCYFWQQLMPCSDLKPRKEFGSILPSHNKRWTQKRPSPDHRIKKLPIMNPEMAITKRRIVLKISAVLIISVGYFIIKLIVKEEKATDMSAVNPTKKNTELKASLPSPPSSLAIFMLIKTNIAPRWIMNAKAHITSLNCFGCCDCCDCCWPLLLKWIVFCSLIKFSPCGLVAVYDECLLLPLNWSSETTIPWTMGMPLLVFIVQWQYYLLFNFCLFGR